MYHCQGAAGHGIYFKVVEGGAPVFPVDRIPWKGRKKPPWRHSRQATPSAGGNLMFRGSKQECTGKREGPLTVNRKIVNRENKEVVPFLSQIPNKTQTTTC